MTSIVTVLKPFTYNLRSLRPFKHIKANSIKSKNKSFQKTVATSTHKYEFCEFHTNKNVNPQKVLLKNKQNNFYPVYRFHTYSAMKTSKCNTNKFTQRTHTCGELHEDHIGMDVKLFGWVEFQRLGMFVVLRDAYGSTQLIIPKENNKFVQIISDLPLESVINVTGVVKKRPEEQCNPKMATGNVEVVVQDLIIVNKAQKQLPFIIREYNKAKESLRLKYRYLDLRYPGMQHNLRLRSRVLMKMREFLIGNGFVDVETPTLFRKTPGGAQEFVVPSQIPGHFYSLVQSPQQFKQLLMVGGLDRYFQIAHCYRDERGRSDRQPEFTQLDIELSYTNQDGVLQLSEELLRYCWPNEGETLSVPFKRITYAEAMEKYGSDKPDTRFGFEIQDLTEYMSESFQTSGANQNMTVRAVNFPRHSISEKAERRVTMDQDNLGLAPASLKTNDQGSGKNCFGGSPKDSGKHCLQIRHFYEICAHNYFVFEVFLAKELRNNLEVINKNEFPKAKLYQVKVRSDGKNEELFRHIFIDSSVPFIKGKMNLHSNDLLFIGIGPYSEVLPLMGKVRVECLRHLHSINEVQPEVAFSPLWVTDFPLFLPVDNSSNMESAHHPFTQPHPEDIDLLNTNPLKVRGLHYDLVINGCEIGGGSIRVHNPQLQLYILKDILQVEPDLLNHLLEALHSGCPPHGGIAFGVDRLMSLLCHTLTIRDVIAFPKGVDGKDFMSGAPVCLSDEELKVYNLKCMVPTKEEKSSIV